MGTPFIILTNGASTLTAGEASGVVVEYAEAFEDESLVLLGWKLQPIVRARTLVGPQLSYYRDLGSYNIDCMVR